MHRLSSYKTNNDRGYWLLFVPALFILSIILLIFGVFGLL